MTNSTTSELKLQRIQIEHVADDTTEVVLRALFLTHGRIEAFSRPVNSLTGRAGSMAFIEMASADAAQAIRALNGHHLGDKVLAVSAARPPAAWEAGADRSPRSAQPRRTVTEYATERTPPAVSE